MPSWSGAELGLALFTIFAAACVSPVVCRFAGRSAGYVLALAPAGFFLYLLPYVPEVEKGEVFRFRYEWIPALDLPLTFFLDGLSLNFALLVSGIGALVVIYTGAYLKGHEQLHRFYLYLLLFMGSMLGLVLADNLIAMFVFWELTSITSYLLIGFNTDLKSRKAALQALLVTGAGGLALLAGLVLLGAAAGQWELSQLIQDGSALREHPLYAGLTLLILLGCFTKSAQFPFHFWLPNAMQAPTPASAYLHSSTMVKAGVYLMMRLNPALGGTDLWNGLITTIGALTMLVSAYLAMRQTVLKPLLAYTTVAALGIITACIGLGTPTAAKAAMLFVFVHAFYKAALFMVAGAIDHETGEKDTEKLGGLFRSMPRVGAAAGLAALSMAGVPVLIGFVGKEVVYEAKLNSLQLFELTVLMTAVGVIANVANFFVAGMVGFKPFWSAKRETPKHPHDGPAGLWMGALLLAVLGIVAGLPPGLTWMGKHLVGPGANAIYGEALDIKLKIWHGFNLPLLLSGVTVALGIAAYTLRAQLRTVLSWAQFLVEAGPARWYEWSLEAMLYTAKIQTRILQNGYLRIYLLLTFLFILLVPGVALVRAGLPPIQSSTVPQPYEVILGGVIILAVAGAVFARTRLSAIVSLGVVGYGIALVFVIFGAPDLAMTQLLVETLTVLLFMLVLRRMPPYVDHSPFRIRLRDAAVAGLSGIFMAGLVISAFEVNVSDTISSWHSQYSMEEAYGRNVVNVILVDFRALDTLGEITVLVIAALGAFGLLKMRSEERRTR